MRTKNGFISPVFGRVFIPQKWVCDNPPKKENCIKCQRPTKRVTQRPDLVSLFEFFIHHSGLM